MANALKDMLTDTGAATPPAKSKAAPPPPAAEPDDQPQGDVAGVLSHIASIELEAVVGGCLQRITFDRGQYGTAPNPAQIKGALLTLDPNAKVRDQFFTKGGGPKDVKTARAQVLIIAVKDTFKKVELVCQNGDDVTVSVGKRDVDEFPIKIEALGKLTPKNLAKVKAAFDDKGEATVILSEPEVFGVKYVDFGGRLYLEEMTPEPPAAETEDAEKDDE